MNCHICICLKLCTQHIAEQWRFTPLKVTGGKERRNKMSEAVGIIRGDRSGDYLVIDVICKIEIKIPNPLMFSYVGDIVKHVLVS